MLQVVAAVLERDGSILVCQRRADQSHPLKWEFPGGKVEPGETPPQALARELEEELAICRAEGREIARYEYCYPGRRPIEILFFEVATFDGEIQNLIFQDLAWSPRENLQSFDFLEGDRDFIRQFTGTSSPPMGHE